MSNFFPNGIGESLGERFGTARPLFSTGKIYYVDSANGNDSYGGSSKELPLATLAAAYTAAASGDTIVLMPTHDETITSALAPTKSVNLVGAGKVGSRPSATITIGTGGSIDLANAGCVGTYVRNIEFACTASGRNVLTIASSSRVLDCYFRTDQDNVSLLRVNDAASAVSIERCEFVSDSTVVANRPTAAIIALSTTTDMRIIDCVVDGGEHNFEYGLSLDGGIQTRLMVEGLTLKGNAPAVINNSSTGWVHVAANLGGSLVDW